MSKGIKKHYCCTVIEYDDYLVGRLCCWFLQWIGMSKMWRDWTNSPKLARQITFCTIQFVWQWANDNGIVITSDWHQQTRKFIWAADPGELEWEACVGFCIRACRKKWPRIAVNCKVLEYAKLVVVSSILFMYCRFFWIIDLMVFFPKKMYSLRFKS